MTPTDPDANALFDQYARERNAETAASVRPAITDERLDELLDRRERRRAEREQREQLARLRGGPCGGCGQVLSLVIQDQADENGTAAVRSELTSFWRPCQNQTLCFECTRLLGTAITLDDLKGAIAYDLLPPQEQRYWMHPALAARVRHLPLLWAEHPGLPTRDTPGSTHERFAFVDTAAILAAIAPPKPYYATGPACGNCGATDRWVSGPSGKTITTYVAGKAVDAMQVEDTWCANCTTYSYEQITTPSPSTSAPGWLGGNLGSVNPLAPAASI